MATTDMAKLEEARNNFNVLADFYNQDERVRGLIPFYLRPSCIYGFVMESEDIQEETSHYERAILAYEEKLDIKPREIPQNILKMPKRLSLRERFEQLVDEQFKEDKETFSKLAEWMFSGEQEDYFRFVTLPEFLPEKVMARADYVTKTEGNNFYREAIAVYEVALGIN